MTFVRDATATSIPERRKDVRRISPEGPRCVLHCLRTRSSGATRMHWTGETSWRYLKAFLGSSRSRSRMFNALGMHVSARRRIRCSSNATCSIPYFEHLLAPVPCLFRELSRWSIDTIWRDSGICAGMPALRMYRRRRTAPPQSRITPSYFG